VLRKDAAQNGNGVGIIVQLIDDRVGVEGVHLVEGWAFLRPLRAHLLEFLNRVGISLLPQTASFLPNRQPLLAPNDRSDARMCQGLSAFGHGEVIYQAGWDEKAPDRPQRAGMGILPYAFLNSGITSTPAFSPSR